MPEQAGYEGSPAQQNVEARFQGAIEAAGVSDLDSIKMKEADRDDTDIELSHNETMPDDRAKSVESKRLYTLADQLATQEFHEPITPEAQAAFATADAYSAEHREAIDRADALHEAAKHDKALAETAEAKYRVNAQDAFVSSDIRANVIAAESGRNIIARTERITNFELEQPKLEAEIAQIQAQMEELRQRLETKQDQLEDIRSKQDELEFRRSEVKKSATQAREFLAQQADPNIPE